MPLADLNEHVPGATSNRASIGWERVVLWVIGGLSIGVALWFTLGPWTVTTAGGTTSCGGSPFMGRFRSAVYDPVDPAAMACHLQAANRMHIAEVAWVVGLVFVVLGIVLLRRARRRSEGSTAP
jgi:hypothetical protein